MRSSESKSSVPGGQVDILLSTQGGLTSQPRLLASPRRGGGLVAGAAVPAPSAACNRRVGDAAAIRHRAAAMATPIWE